MSRKSSIADGSPISVDVDFHQFYVGPLDLNEAEYQWTAVADDAVLVPAPDGRSFAVSTGIATGDVFVEVRDRAPDGPGWEHDAMELSITELWCAESWGAGSEPLFAPLQPGTHRVDVYAKNRGLHPDEAIHAKRSERERYVSVFTPLGDPLMQPPAATLHADLVARLSLQPVADD